MNVAFQLACEAKWIDLVILFDPMVAVHSPNIDPLGGNDDYIADTLAIDRLPCRCEVKDCTAVMRFNRCPW